MLRNNTIYYRYAYFLFNHNLFLPTEREMSAPNPTQNPTQTVTSIVPAAAVPSPAVLVQAAKLAMAQDKPILLDYFADSATDKAFVGEDPETKEQMLVKSAEEFTSLVQKMYKVGTDYIIMTENSIYIVSGLIKKRKIQASSLRQD